MARVLRMNNRGRRGIPTVYDRLAPAALNHVSWSVRIEPGFPALKILLVEDSQRLQRSISAGLRSRGYTVDQAYDGKQALDFTDAYGYDMIILDLMLPQVDGLTVLKTLRRKRNRSYVLISRTCNDNSSN